MNTEVEPLHVRVYARDAVTRVPLAEVLIQLQSPQGREVREIAQALTGPDGVAVLDLDSALWRQELTVSAAGQGGPGVPVTHGMLDGAEDAVIDVAGAEHVDRGQLGMLAEHLVATRKVRADDVASDLASPGRDSIARLLPAATRARLLADLDRAVGNTGDAFILDPHALRDGQVQVIPMRDLKDRFDIADRPHFDPDLFIKPGLGWDIFTWVLPDDQSYRDYLRGSSCCSPISRSWASAGDPTTFPRSSNVS